MVEATSTVSKLYYFRRGIDEFADHDFEEQQRIVSTKLKDCCRYVENLHFFIGSGCSYPAIPLMKETFGTIKNNYKKELEGLLDEYRNARPDDKEQIDIENFLNWLNTALNFHKNNSDQYQTFKDAVDLVKKELLKSININYSIKDISTCEGDNNILKTLKYYRDFYNIIFSLREFNKQLPPINIFTTNYDLFNEIAMEELNIHYTNGFRGYITRSFDPSVYHLRLVDDENRYKEKWDVIRRYAKLYKIHGSIDWKYDQNRELIIQSSFNLEQSKDSTEEATKDVVIYPTIHKHFESQQSPYSELFRLFTINLQKRNSTLIVLGYGFPDDHINQLMAQSLHNEDFNLIVFGNIEESNTQAFYNRHKDKHNFHLIGGDYQKKNDGHHFVHVLQLLGAVSDHVQSQ